MTIREAVQFIHSGLEQIYDKGEVSAISDRLIGYLAGTEKTSRALQKEKSLSPAQEALLNEFLDRLLRYEPLQYVLQEAWFCGLKFYVDKNVLIPRPETEELTEWVIANCRFPIDQLSILDVGTGSGCMAITLKRKLRKANVWACDSSAAALAVARQNANELGVEVSLLQLDFLDAARRASLGSFDIIVSNPPYIPQKDKDEMAPNVLNYEPHQALFVPGDDALVFYRAIADFGKKHLNADGMIYAELHESASKAADQLFQLEGYDTAIKRDMQGKERMLRAVVRR